MTNSKYKYLHAYCKQRDDILKQLIDKYSVNRDTVKNLFYDYYTEVILTHGQERITLKPPKTLFKKIKMI